MRTQSLQNWNRDYDLLLGWYVQSDPVGLLGGINTYAYVNGNPLGGVDPEGLFWSAAFRGAWAFGSVIGGTIGYYLSTPQGRDATDDIAQGLINGADALCRDTDPGASSSSAPLQACLRAAEGDSEDWGQFCRSLPKILGLAVAGKFSAKAGCLRQEHASTQSKINWCHNQFGN